MRLLPLFAILASPAAAGCDNFVDGSLDSAPPAYEICYEGTCDVVTVEWQCANVSDFTIQWTGGWSRRCQAGVEACKWAWQDRPIRPDRAARITAELFGRAPG